MAGFEIKVTPRNKEEISNYKNFFFFKNCDFHNHSGRVIYMNANFPDRHLYQAFYIKGNMAKLMWFNTGVGVQVEAPMLTLQELSYEDVIIYYNEEEAEASKARQATKKP